MFSKTDAQTTTILFSNNFKITEWCFFFKYSQTDAQTTKTLATIAWTSSFAGKTKESLILD